MNDALWLALALGVTVITSVVMATWILLSKINSIKSDLSKEISDLKTEIAVLKEREAQNAEKTEQMWKWWLKSIENGWIANMKAIAAAD